LTYLVSDGDVSTRALTPEVAEEEIDRVLAGVYTGQEASEVVRPVDV
jgi:hypothetical protein